MRFALFIIAFLSFLSYFSFQSPHGDIKIPCSDCHSEEGWKPLRKDLKFDHSTTGFVLAGAHSRVNCIDCHKYNASGQLIFSEVNKSCSSCHFDRHSGSLGQNCEGCHSFETWRLSDVILRHRRARFPLFGSHASLNCNECHLRDGVFKVFGIPTECVSCHRDRYFEVKDPNHVELNFGMKCENCHSIRASSWRGEVGFHSRTGFPLTGAHASVKCNECHVNGQYKGLSADCYPCHQADYERAVNPNHSVLNFPTACAQCHTTQSWKPAPGFDHDGRYFRIYSGKHNRRWGACTDCHYDVNNYQVFSCLNCHEHRQSKMDSEHRNVSGYRYESQACYSCHRRV